MTEFALDRDDYLGLLDDVVWRYPWERRLEASDVEMLLVERFLFAGRTLVNDGYLVSQPSLLAQVPNPGSLLNLLIEAGHVQIASGRLPISASILARAQSGVATQAALVDSQEWPTISAGLDRVSERPGATVPWPSRDLTRGFETLARRWAEAGPEDANAGAETAFVERFFDTLAADPRAPRTKWETVVQSEMAEGRLKPDQASALMQRANQFYHVNFAAALVLTHGQALTVSTWLDPQLIALMEPATAVGVPTYHSVPSMRLDPGSGVDLVKAVRSNPGLVEARAYYLAGWRDPQRANDYASALQAVGRGSALVVHPATLFDPDTGIIDSWAFKQSSGGIAARILLTPQRAAAMLGEGTIFAK